MICCATRLRDTITYDCSIHYFFWNFHYFIIPLAKILSIHFFVPKQIYNFHFFFFNRSLHPRLFSKLIISKTDILRSKLYVAIVVLHVIATWVKILFRFKYILHCQLLPGVFLTASSSVYQCNIYQLIMTHVGNLFGNLQAIFGTRPKNISSFCIRFHCYPLLFHILNSTSLDNFWSECSRSCLQKSLS